MKNKYRLRFNPSACYGTGPRGGGNWTKYPLPERLGGGLFPRLSGLVSGAERGEKAGGKGGGENRLKTLKYRLDFPVIFI